MTLNNVAEFSIGYIGRCTAIARGRRTEDGGKHDDKQLM
jgi:hypothetical protein